MNVIQVAAVGVIGAVLALQMKSGKSEFGTYIVIGVSLVFFFGILAKLQVVVEAIQTIRSYIQLDTAYIGTILKMIGVTYVAEFSAAICRDAGYQTIAGQIEIFSKLTVLTLGLPILLALLETIHSFLT